MAREKTKQETNAPDLLTTENAAADMITKENYNDDNGIESYRIYNNNIELLCDELITRQFDNKSKEELKQNRSFFPCLISYIYNNYLGELLQNNLKYKIKKIKPVYPDIIQLDNLFSIYIDLVYKYKYNNKPSILDFSILTGISRNTFYEWINNTGNESTRGYITPEYSDTVQKWLTICEAALVDGTNGDTIRDIFILKSKFGYRDQNNTITVNHVCKPVIDADNLPDLLGINSKN